jgi:excisionase family DNA binding protein
MADEKLLSPEDVGERLGVSHYTVLTWIKRGRLKGRKIGKYWRVKPEDLEVFIENPPPMPRVPRAPKAAHMEGDA